MGILYYIYGIFGVSIPILVFCVIVHAAAACGIDGLATIRIKDFSWGRKVLLIGLFILPLCLAVGFGWSKLNIHDHLFEILVLSILPISSVLFVYTGSLLMKNDDFGSGFTQFVMGVTGLIFVFII
ncbi:hypothetical protein [Paenibacillus xylanilyticus]|uniref:Uncharacterized protein n=1 Tax=Paenibacillus xylanilyticus TaxID=248903 RepID=A0A7Y6BUZ1_9BACL|nr:hypothetical protein [Paenibacillus xylanilyticus]NUU74630.1 hypothetical protein [Paenibacillus xylanilyticus]